jgi:acyl-coenzyme A thioesterase PaaI-like protein
MFFWGSDFHFPKPPGGENLVYRWGPNCNDPARTDRNPNQPMLTSVTELPFNRFLGLETATAAPKLLQLPAGAQYLNHLGTVHASAQLALAEASSGEFLLRHLGPATDVVPVVRRLEAKFRKPANGAITSTVSTLPEALAPVRTELGSRGRALASIAVDVHDESGAHTLSATVEWFVTRISNTP